jgi:hypothetical protein
VALVLKSSNQDGRAPWSRAVDITVVRNRIIAVNGGVDIGRDAITPRDTNPGRIYVAHNVFESLGQFNPGTGAVRLFQVTGETSGPIVFAHNTGFPTYLHLSVEARLGGVLSFNDNLVTHGLYGRSLQVLGGQPPAIVGNLMIGGPAPTGNHTATSMAMAGVSAYALSPSSPFRGRATDGGDPGADIAAVQRATQGVIVP